MHLFLYIFGDCIADVFLYIIHYFSQSAKDFKQNTSKFVQKAFYFKNYIVSRRKLFFLGTCNCCEKEVRREGVVT